eukprot:14463516-Alexandrium_andersonii.AAC.1
MSASLVGSEMCIRDSQWRGLFLRGVIVVTHRVGTSCSEYRFRDILCPVSYTHLTLPTICSV